MGIAVLGGVIGALVALRLYRKRRTDADAGSRLSTRSSIAILVLGLAGILTAVTIVLGAVLGVAALIWWAVTLRSSARSALAVGGAVAGTAAVAVSCTGVLLFFDPSLHLGDPAVLSRCLRAAGTNAAAQQRCEFAYLR